MKGKGSRTRPQFGFCHADDSHAVARVEMDDGIRTRHARVPEKIGEARKAVARKGQVVDAGIRSRRTRR